MIYPLPKKLPIIVLRNILDHHCWIALLAISAPFAANAFAQTSTRTTGWSKRPAIVNTASTQRNFHRGTLDWQSPSRPAVGQSAWNDATPRADSRAHRQAMLFHATPRTQPRHHLTSQATTDKRPATADPFSNPFGDEPTTSQPFAATAAPQSSTTTRPLFQLSEWDTEDHSPTDAIIQQTNWQEPDPQPTPATTAPRRLTMTPQPNPTAQAPVASRPTNLFGTTNQASTHLARPMRTDVVPQRISPPPTPIRAGEAQRNAIHAVRPDVHKTIRQVSEVQVDDPLGNDALFQTPQLQSPSDLDSLNQLPSQGSEEFSVEPPTTRSDIVPPRNESLFEPIQPMQPSIESPLQPDPVTDPPTTQNNSRPDNFRPNNPRPRPPRLDRFPPRNGSRNPNQQPSETDSEPLESMLNLDSIQPQPAETESPFQDDPPQQPAAQPMSADPQLPIPDPQPTLPETQNRIPGPPQNQYQNSPETVPSDTLPQDVPPQDTQSQDPRPQEPFDTLNEPLQIPDEFAPIDPPSQDLPPSNDFQPIPDTAPERAPELPAPETTPDLGLESPYQAPDDNDRPFSVDGGVDAGDGLLADNVPCDRKYNDRNCCQEERECVKVLDRIRQRTIDSITIDITPPYEVSDDDPTDMMQRKQEKLDLIAARDWYDRSGNLITTGTLKDMRRGKVILEGEQGEVALSMQELGRDEICFVTSYWNLPAECPLPGDDYAIRDFTMITYAWTASAACHKPLWFEDVALERYGHSAGPVKQSLFSAAHFFGSAILLPYNSRLYPPTECRYALGYYQPGDCAPWLLHAFPLSKRAAIGELLTVLGFWGYVQ